VSPRAASKNMPRCAPAGHAPLQHAIGARHDRRSAVYLQTDAAGSQATPQRRAGHRVRARLLRIRRALAHRAAARRHRAAAARRSTAPGPSPSTRSPANRRILRESETGSGRVLEDNGAAIDDDISTYSESVPTPPHHAAVPSTRGPELRPGLGRRRWRRAALAAPATTTLSPMSWHRAGGCGCRVAGSGPSSAWLLVAFAVVLGSRRRRRAAR